MLRRHACLFVKGGVSRQKKNPRLPKQNRRTKHEPSFDIDYLVQIRNSSKFSSKFSPLLNFFMSLVHVINLLSHQPHRPQHFFYTVSRARLWLTAMFGGQRPGATRGGARGRALRGKVGLKNQYLVVYACLAVGYLWVLANPSLRRRLFGIFRDSVHSSHSTGRGVGAGLVPSHGHGGHGHGGHGHGVGQHVKLGVDLSRTPFWDKHFHHDKKAELDNFASALFLEYIGDRSLNLNRARARKLTPFFDSDNDGAITQTEYEQFIDKFSKPDGSSGGLRTTDPAKLRLQLRSALVEAVARIQRRKGGGTDSSLSGGGGCGMRLEAGKSEYLDVLQSGDLQFGGTQEFTIEMWVKPEPVAAEQRGAVLVSKYNRGKWGQYFVRLQPDEGGEAKRRSENLRVFFHREVAPWGHKSDSTVPSGYFSHIGVTYAKGYSSIYINGSLSGSQKEGAQDNNPETTVMLGAMLEKGAPIDFFSGVIDEVRMWRVARTQEQLRDSMHLSLSGMETGLVAYWQFDDCLGDRVREKIGTSGHDAVKRGGEWVQSPVKFRSYQESFGCVDSHC